VGLISDTHGLLRPEALRALEGVELVIHAGDVGRPEVLEQLKLLGTVHAVRGNVDRERWARSLPETLTLEVAGARIHVLHDLESLSEPADRPYSVVVSGHSHVPRVESRGGVLYVNPGSAGPRRFRLPVSVARLRLSSGAAEAEILRLEVG
jgi:putative phosphoesterase